MKKFFQKISEFFVEGGLKETVLRFPLSSLCALILGLLVIAATHDWIDSSDGRIIVILGSGYLWFGIVRVIAESRSWDRVKEYFLGFAFFIPFVALMLFTKQFEQYAVFIIPALLLLILVAPYTQSLRKPENDFSFWFFNMQLWLGVVISLFIIGLMTGGLSLALHSIKLLFEVDMSYKTYADIWAISAAIVGPVYALSRVPKEFHYDPVECDDPIGLRFVLNWVLAPLILIYFIILYAYLVKLLVIQELPLGSLAYMVTGFAGVSVATYLAGWPYREKAGALLRKIYKYLFIALAIPVIMQMFAIGERIHSFGVTEQRYMVAMSAIWLALIIGIFLFKKSSASIKIIPVILAAFLIIASFGPWGAVNLSGISQISRLENLLVQYNILQDGEIVKTDQEIPFADRKNITSKLQYLKSTDRLKTIETWFDLDENGKDKETKKYVSIEDIAKKMGFQPVYDYQRQNVDNLFNFNHYDYDRTLQDISGFDYLSRALSANKVIEGQESRNNKITPEEGEGFPEISWRLRDNILNIEIAGRGSVQFDLTNFTNEKIDKYGLVQYGAKITDSEEAVLTEKVGNMKIRLVITSISGKIEDEVPMVENISFTMLLDL